LGKKAHFEALGFFLEVLSRGKGFVTLRKHNWSHRAGSCEAARNKDSM
jgi:hypothetical protein